MIGDGKDKFLILSDEKQFEAQNLTIKQHQQPGKMQPKEAKYCTLLQRYASLPLMYVISVRISENAPSVQSKERHFFMEET